MARYYYCLLGLLALSSSLVLGALLPPDQASVVAPATKHQSSQLSGRGGVLEIERQDIFGFPFYFTNIAIGTPAQAFALYLDLSFGGVVVRGKECERCGRDIFSYDKSASSTCEDPNLQFSLALAAHNARGAILRDAMHLASLRLPNASFGAAEGFYGENYPYLIFFEIRDE